MTFLSLQWESSYMERRSFYSNGAQHLVTLIIMILCDLSIHIFQVLHYRDWGEHMIALSNDGNLKDLGKTVT